MHTLEFVHISDFHYQRSYEGTPIERLTDQTGQTLTDMLTSGLQTIRASHSGLDFAVATGDLTQHGTAEDYRRLQKILAAQLPGTPVFAVPGNHDDALLHPSFPPPVSGETGLCRSAVFRGLRIISLDSRGGAYESGRLLDTQLSWLAQTLSERAEAGSILLLHHTPHTSGEVDYLLYQMEHPGELYEIIRGSDIRGIFAGHTHKHFTSMLGAIPCYTAESLTYGIETGPDRLTIHNRTGYNHCILKNGCLEVRHITLEPEAYKEASTLYSEMGSGYCGG